jgi:hypothetical protein
MDFNDFHSEIMGHWGSIFASNLKYINYHWDEYPVPVRRKMYEFMQRAAKRLGNLADMQEVPQNEKAL